jgi:hypothetical protein
VKAEEYQSEVRGLSGIKVEIRSYRLEDTYYCHIANTDAGATIARASGATREEAIEAATEKARQRLR